MQSESKIKKLSWKNIFYLIKTTFVEFFKEQSFFHGAALSYYAIFALVPMIYLALISFGRIVGQDTVLMMIEDLLHEQVGLKDAAGLMDFLQQVNFEKSSLLLNIVGIFALLLSSTAMLSSLRTSINEFYDIKVSIADRRKRLEHTIGTKLVSIMMLPVFASVLMIMYFGETFIMSLETSLFGDLNGIESILITVTLTTFSIFMNGLLFTLVFKYVHDGFMPFKVAFGGGLITAVLLFLGQLLIKFYLQNYFFGSKAGVAGTILVLLAWMYYTSQIIFLGAKFTKVYADFVGRTIHFTGRKVTTKKIVNKITKSK